MTETRFARGMAGAPQKIVHKSKFYTELRRRLA